jgi:hypothetical protein
MLTVRPPIILGSTMLKRANIGCPSTDALAMWSHTVTGVKLNGPPPAIRVVTTATKGSSPYSAPASVAVRNPALIVVRQYTLATSARLQRKNVVAPSSAYAPQTCLRATPPRVIASSVKGTCTASSKSAASSRVVLFPKRMLSAERFVILSNASVSSSFSSAIALGKMLSDARAMKERFSTITIAKNSRPGALVGEAALVCPEDEQNDHHERDAEQRRQPRPRVFADGADEQGEECAHGRVSAGRAEPRFFDFGLR